jgi:hypothetical protein
MDGWIEWWAVAVQPSVRERERKREKKETISSHNTFHTQLNSGETNP